MFFLSHHIYQIDCQTYYFYSNLFHDLVQLYKTHCKGEYNLNRNFRYNIFSMYVNITPFRLFSEARGSRSQVA